MFACEPEWGDWFGEPATAAAPLGGGPAYALEGAILSSGSAVAWLSSGLGILGAPADSEALARSGRADADVWFVPALLGMGTPEWDFGARGALLGLTRGTSRAQVVRAVLEGVAQRGADLLEAAELDSGLPVPTLRVDGGMSANELFLQALADATGRPVEVAPVLEATTLGAGFLAGMAVGTWTDESDVADASRPRQVVVPAMADDTRAARRARWMEARHRAEATIPDLSGISF